MMSACLAVAHPKGERRLAECEGRFSNLVRAKRSLIRASAMQGVGLSIFALLDYRD
jgi:hypothetical protein